MPSVLFCVVCVLGGLTITEQRNKPIADIENLLEYLAQVSAKNKPDEVQPPPIHYGQRPQRKRLPNEEDNANLMNLYYKQNDKNKNQVENDFDNLSRLDTDHLCKMTGRCGCTRGRCGGQFRAEEKSVNDVDRLLKNLIDDINMEKREKEKDRDEHKRNYSFDASDLTLKRTKNTDDDDFDIVFLEVPDSDDNLILSQLQDLRNDVKIIDLRDNNLNNYFLNRASFSNDNEKNQLTYKPLTPEEFVSYYDEGKNKISNILLEFVKGHEDDSMLDLLLPQQRKQIHLLKKMHSRSVMPDNDIKTQIIGTIFGDLSSSKVLPQAKDENIYIPLRVYDAIRKVSKGSNTRKTPEKIKKRLLPLTWQQKNKHKAEPKLMSKLSWRRNAQQPTYGVPFDFDVQGLVQIK